MENEDTPIMTLLSFSEDAGRVLQNLSKEIPVSTSVEEQLLHITTLLLQYSTLQKIKSKHDLADHALADLVVSIIRLSDNKKFPSYLKGRYEYHLKCQGKV